MLDTVLGTYTRSVPGYKAHGVVLPSFNETVVSKIQCRHCEVVHKGQTGCAMSCSYNSVQVTINRAAQHTVL